MSLVDRVQGILTAPRTEWMVIDREPSTVESLYTGYIVPLAAIPAVCIVLSSILWGGGVFYGVVTGILQYVLTLVGVFIIALIIAKLAPTFGGRDDTIQGLKVAAYSSTPGWLAGIFNLVPRLSILALIAGLYGLYLLYVGLPILMKSPADRSVGYIVLVIVAAIVVYAILGMVVGAIVAMFFLH